MRLRKRDRGDEGVGDGDVSPSYDERRVYRAIVKGGPVDPRDRDMATAVLRRWTLRSWRLALLVIAVVCAIWQLYDEIGRLAYATTWTTGALTLVWAAAAVVLLAAAPTDIPAALGACQPPRRNRTDP
jgi:hypothetical protein